MDGVDAVLVKFIPDKSAELIQSLSFPIPEELRSQLKAVIKPGWQGTLSSIGRLHQELGKLFADACNALLLQARINKNQIQAIGSHGQTLWHQPDGTFPFSLQLGDGNIIAELTGIRTVADFRNRDIAAGGQGAPLVPAFHKEIFCSPDIFRVILNIGGIANITVLPPSQHKKSVSGFDTGPGNALLDTWISHNKNRNYDQNGDWAASGKIHNKLLKQLLQDPFFFLPPPKSTGKELFNLQWLRKQSEDSLNQYRAADIQATLCELTATSIANCIPEECEELYICGGGVHNRYLMQRLQNLLPGISIASSQTLGVDPDWMEAIAFAWLAKQTIEGKPGNLPVVTGAKGTRVLGAVYSAS